MHLTKILLALNVAFLGLSMTSCQRNSHDVWEDSKSAKRHMSRGLRTLGGKNGSSKAVQCRDDFGVAQEQDWGYQDVECQNSVPDMTMGEFVPLSGQSNDEQIAMADFISRQPREIPGDPGSSIPGIDAFADPNTNAEWAAVFHNIYFDYNSNLVRGEDNLNVIRSIANYMKSHPNTYIFAEGHTDERGPEVYNLALGSRRSNAVRNLLLEEGVNPDNVFTISYGKERPVFHGKSEESWAQNRRVEFKVYRR